MTARQLFSALVAVAVLAGCREPVAAGPTRGTQGQTPQSAHGLARDAPGVLRALARARPGDVIRLAPGRYVGLAITGFHGWVTITSQSGEKPAILTDLLVDSSTGLTFRGLELSTAGTAVGPLGAEDTLAFRVVGSHDIHFVGLKVDGAQDSDLAHAVSGFMIRDSSQVSIEDSDFSHLHNAINFLDDDQLSLVRNRFHELFDDAMRGDASDVLIAGNRCYSNHPDPGDPDHPDCIQLWNITSQGHDIRILDNVYDRGSGLPTQGIFLETENADMPFLNVEIRGNRISGAMYNGIMVQHARGLKLRDNIVSARCDMTSRIRIEDVTHGEVAHNEAAEFIFKNTTDVRHADNLVNRCR